MVVVHYQYFVMKYLQLVEYFEDGNGIISNVINHPSNAIGFTGIGHYLPHKNNLFAIGILKESNDNNNNCVYPTQDTIDDGSYPLRRPLQTNIIKNNNIELEIINKFIKFGLNATIG